MLLRFVLFTLLLSGCFLACTNKPQSSPAARNGAFAKPRQAEEPDMQRIIEGGELIIATISGPDTYFDYQGTPMGLQYALAEDFAASIGVGLRVTLYNDTTALVQALQEGQADLVAVQLPEAMCRRHQLLATGVTRAERHTAWAVQQSSTGLAEALQLWYSDGLESRMERKEKARLQARQQVRRTVRAPFISREKGIISTYDNLFKQAAVQTGWDWRLIAAQCYQESGFDPNAVSWAGAKGLMQIMPATARHLGLAEDHVFSPTENVAAAARYIRELQDKFPTIADPEEKVKFVLASYNGGAGHINDAQALARKHGGDPHRWQDVSYYVKGLSQPRYYRDPVVRHGYMIGNETYHYVESIMQRWQQYGGNVRNITAPVHRAEATQSTPGTPHTSGSRWTHKRNRYSKEQKILSPEELDQSR